MDTTALAKPLSSSLTVREARDAYLAENGFSIEEYASKWTKASFFGIRFVVPNTRRHRFGIMLHDLHHVATGYGTDLAGEGEISGWELRQVSSLGAYVGGIVTLGAAMGFLLEPRRTVAAFRAGRHHTPLFATVLTEREYEELLDLTVGELRERVGVAGDGLADRPRALHAYARADEAVVAVNSS